VPAPDFAELICSRKPVESTTRRMSDRLRNISNSVAIAFSLATSEALIDRRRPRGSTRIDTDDS